MDPLAYSVLSVIAVSLVSLAGVFVLSSKLKKFKGVLIYIVSFAAGGLIGDAFLHLLPEVAEDGFSVGLSVSILAGIIFSFILEKFILWRHCHLPTSHDHPHPFAFTNLIGDAVHNFIDGLIIGASYLVSIPVGIATTVAVIFHEIPQEIGDFSILLHAGFTRQKALLLNFLIALTAVLGAIIAYLLQGFVENVILLLVPFAAGMFIYIACSDLIPELHRHEFNLKNAVLQLVFFLAGIGMMALLLLLE